MRYSASHWHLHCMGRTVSAVTHCRDIRETYWYRRHMSHWCNCIVCRPGDCDSHAHDARGSCGLLWHRAGRLRCCFHSRLLRSRRDCLPPAHRQCSCHRHTGAYTCSLFIQLATLQDLLIAAYSACSLPVSVLLVQQIRDRELRLAGCDWPRQQGASAVCPHCGSRGCQSHCGPRAACQGPPGDLTCSHDLCRLEQACKACSAAVTLAS